MEDFCHVSFLQHLGSFHYISFNYIENKQKKKDLLSHMSCSRFLYDLLICRLMYLLASVLDKMENITSKTGREKLGKRMRERDEEGRLRETGTENKLENEAMVHQS